MKLIVALVVVLTLAAAAPVGATPDSQMTWAVHTTLVPAWFDPAETMIGSSFLVLYALHDALVKPMPGKSMAPSLAEAWSVSSDGLVYEFVLRKGVRFHNGDALTAEGEDGFKKAPVGAGPYRFVSFSPGVELVLEAFDAYWRKAPEVKRLVLRVVPDPATRLAALKRGEVDIAYSMPGELGDEIKRSGLTLKAVFPSVHWLYFADQWDAKSPWHDRRVRVAANLAIDRQAINQARTFGLSKVTGSIVPSAVDFYWQPPAPVYDPAKAKALLAEAGYPGGFDAGDYYCDMTSSDAAEMMIGFLQTAGIRARLRPIERASFNKSIAEKKLRNSIQVIAGANGNAATRLEEFVITGGTLVYGSSPDLDGLFREQAGELDRAKRQAILHRIQQLVHERAIFAPIYELAFLNGVGARVAESAFGLITAHAFAAPYEDVKLKPR